MKTTLILVCIIAIVYAEKGWVHQFGSKAIDTLPDYAMPMPGGLAHFGMIKYKGNYIVFGGEGYANDIDGVKKEAFLNDVWELNTTSMTWTLRFSVGYGNAIINETLPSPGGMSRFGMVLNSEQNGFFVIGGYGYANDSALYGHLNTVWSFDLRTNTWRFLHGDKYIDATPVESGIFGSRRELSAMLSMDGTKIYAFGGYGHADPNCVCIGILFAFDL